MASINDIFNRPPSISEDTLQYILYLPTHQSDRVSATSLTALLSKYVQNLLPGHIWHRDAFELKVAPDPERNKDVWHIEGRMRVGDCIDDEWCAVWLLRELSSEWDVVISVSDSDGEFLLIEAADELPSWVTPANAENRVWIHNSRLHLIPLSHMSPPSSQSRHRKHLVQENIDDADKDDDDTEFITAADATRLVRDPTIDTAAPQKVQDTLWRRISGYPAASRQHMHVTKAYLPIDVAKTLAINPLLVQKAVETFYTRDAIQLRAAQKMIRFPPEPATLTSVKMTRTAYAQLAGQKFHPPKVFGRWSERDGGRVWHWRDVGMKIACGFEMLYQESKSRKDTAIANSDGSPSSLEALKDSLRRNADYVQYLQRLVSAGYFKGELEGSQLWMSLESQAASAFVAARQDDDASRPSFASSVQVAIKDYADDRALPSSDEDPDDWLKLNAADFDTMLEKAVDTMDVDSLNDNEDCIANAQAERLRGLAKQVEDFVKGEGDVDGARFADEGFSDDEDSEDTTDLYGDDSGDDGSVQGNCINPSDLSHLTPEEHTARQEAMDKLVTAIDPSEYGKMPPSFQSNSQQVAPAMIDMDIRDEISVERGTGDAYAVHSRPIRPPILPRDNFDGVDSDDETDEEDLEDDGEDAEERPQVVGEVEIDMEEEEEEFLEFARQALGVTDEHWKAILKERGERGAFVPAHVFAEPTQAPVKANRTSITSPMHTTLSSESQKRTLESFETVMRAMDAELAYKRGGMGYQPDSVDKGKARAGANEEMDIEAAMEAELKELLNQDDGDDDDDDDDVSERGGEQVDYQLIKNFLESFKSQAGLSGPVGTLSGRLQAGWTLPRDEA